MVIRFFRFSGISFPLIALSNIAVDLQGSRSPVLLSCLRRAQLFLTQFAGSSKLKAFVSKPCPDAQFRILGSKQIMKLSAGTGNRLSSLTYRTATFCDSGGGQPEHMERMFLQIRDNQRERQDKGREKEAKARVELLPHRHLHPHERGNQAMERVESLPLQ